MKIAIAWIRLINFSYMIIDWKIIAKIIITYLEQRPKWLHGVNLPSDQKPLLILPCIPQILNINIQILQTDQHTFLKRIFKVIVRDFDKRSKKLFSLLMIIPRHFVTFSCDYVLILKERLTLITFWNLRVDYTVLRFSNTATVNLQTNS